jgi:SAM-dependent methyltransferase
MFRSRKPEPVVFPYLTVEEMRSAPRLIEEGPRPGGGSRFEGSTNPEMALKYLPKDGAILECGPVFGTFAQFMLERGYTNWHALDFVNLLHLPDRSKVEFHQIDFSMEAMPYPDERFDGVAAWGIAEHLENPFHFFREVWRVLKPGAPFLFSLPNVAHISSRYDFFVKGIFPRWSVKSNHIAVLCDGIIEKTIYRYFEPVETIYTKPGTMVTRKNKTALRKYFDGISKKVLPANKLFGNYVGYVLKRRAEILPPVTAWPPSATSRSTA